MKKILIIGLLCIAFSMVWLICLSIPYSSKEKALIPLCDTTIILKDLETIINTSKSRNYKNTDILDSVSSYIKSIFTSCSPRCWFQEYEVQGKKYRNVIASFGPENAERIIVGAHYDVCGNQPGADDNASGVAGLLSFARLLKKYPIQKRIDLVAYTLEEPPFFGTNLMGSYIHAKSLHDSSIKVTGMVCLEMIGYYSDEPHSQDYPIGFLKWAYGNKGNYITLVQKPFNGRFPNEFKKTYFKNNSILTKSFKAPSFIGGLDLSDHRNYWKFGYSAVMVTNTAFFRNKNYHTTNDLLSRLNINKMGLVIEGVYRTLKEV